MNNKKLRSSRQVFGAILLLVLKEESQAILYQSYVRLRNDNTIVCFCKIKICLLPID